MKIITAKQAAKQSHQSLKTVQNTVYDKNTDFDLSTLDCVMRNIESAIAKIVILMKLNHTSILKSEFGLICVTGFLMKIVKRIRH